MAKTYRISAKNEGESFDTSYPEMDIPGASPGVAIKRYMDGWVENQSGGPVTLGPRGRMEIKKRETLIVKIERL